jgi:hypothetical protein
MATITPSNILLHSMGSLNLTIGEFPDGADPADIWPSSISNIVAVWASRGDTATNGSGAGVTASWTAAGGVISIHGEGNIKPWIFVLSGFANQ